MNTVEKTIEHVLDTFDFYRVGKTMSALEWHWIGSMFGVPTLEELRKASRELLTEAYKLSLENKSEVRLGTGGFYVTADTTESPVFFSLTFQVDTVDSDTFAEEEFPTLFDEGSDSEESEKTIIEFPREV